MKTLLFCFVGLALLTLFIILLVSMFLPSKKEANKYGPVPEGNDRHLIWIILGALFPAALNIFALGIIGGYSQSMMKYRVTKTEDELAQLVDGARTLFAGQKNYAALIDETIVQYKLLPEENIQQDNNHYRFTNPYNGTLSVSVGSANHFADQRALQIKITEIRAEACIDLAKLYWQTPQSGFIAAMITNGNSAYDKYIDSVTAYNCKNSVQPEYAIVCGNNPSPTSFEHIKSGCHFNHNTMILKFF